MDYILVSKTEYEFALTKLPDADMCVHDNINIPFHPAGIPGVIFDKVSTGNDDPPYYKWILNKAYKVEEQ